MGIFDLLILCIDFIFCHYFFSLVGPSINMVFAMIRTEMEVVFKPAYYSHVNQSYGISTRIAMLPICPIFSFIRHILSPITLNTNLSVP